MYIYTHMHMHKQKVHINFIFIRQFKKYFAFLAFGEKVISPKISKWLYILFIFYL